MKKSFLIVLLILLLPINVNAFELGNEVFNVSNWSDETFIYLTSDGGYVAVGGQDSTNGTDAVIAKYDLDGNKEWEKMYDGGFDDEFRDVIQTKDGGYLAVGSSNAGESVRQAVIVKFDKNGKLEWKKLDSDFYYFYSLDKTDDDVYSFMSYLSYVEKKYFKVDEDGNFLIYASSVNSDVLSTEDGGKYVLSNELITLGFEKNYYGIKIIKYDKDSNIVWEKNNYLTNGGRNIAEFAMVTFDGGLLVQLYNTEWEWTRQIVKYDKDGNLSWSTYVRNETGSPLIYIEKENGNFGILYEKYDPDNGILYDIIVEDYDKDGNFISEKKVGDELFYRSNSSISIPDDLYIIKDGSYLVKYDKTFNEVQRIKMSDNIKGIYEVAYTQRGELFVAALNDNLDITIAKYNEKGKETWSKTTVDSEFDFVTDFLYINDSQVMLKAIKNNKEGPIPTYVIKLRIDYDIISESTSNGEYEIVQEQGIAKILLSPNKGYELDKIVIKDSDGESLDYTENNGEYHFNLDDGITVGVSYKKAVENPNTNVFIRPGIIVILIVTLFICYFMKKNRVSRYN